MQLAACLSGSRTVFLENRIEVIYDGLIWYPKLHLRLSLGYVSESDMSDTFYAQAFYTPGPCILAYFWRISSGRPRLTWTWVLSYS